VGRTAQPLRAPCERPVAASGDSLGLIIQHAFHVTGLQKTNQDAARLQMALNSTKCGMRLKHSRSLKQVLRAGAKHAHTKGTYSESTQTMAPDVSLSLSLVMTAATAPQS